MERILVVAAHPDDEVLGCGAAMGKFRANGAAVRVVFLAEGVTARYELDEIDTPQVREAIRYRDECAMAALRILGVERDDTFLSARLCCRLDREPLIDSVKIIERHIAEFQPTVLFTHAAHDVNIDHRVAHWATLAAIRPVGQAGPQMVLAFEVLSSTDWNPTEPFRPNVFEDVSDHLDLKLRALAAYDREMRPAPHSRSREVVTALATYRGAQAGVRYAEAFAVIRGIGIARDAAPGGTAPPTLDA